MPEKSNMGEVTFTVSKHVQGWIVSGTPPTGPFICKDHALDLAQGMADAIILLGGSAQVVVEAQGY